jgi:hypothetical protein
MTSNNQVSPVIRISRGERDASARATHLKAASKKYLETTIERKQMSTTTNFKRIALVAVAALGLGVLSSVPSNAAVSSGTVTATNGTDSTRTAYTESTTVGTQATINVRGFADQNADSFTVTLSAGLTKPADSGEVAFVMNYKDTVGATTNVVVTEGSNLNTFVRPELSDTTSAGTALVVTKGSMSYNDSVTAANAYLGATFGININNLETTDVTAGTYTGSVVVKFYDQGALVNTKTVVRDFSIVVSALATATLVADAGKSTAVLAQGTTATNNSAYADSATVSAAATAGTSGAVIRVWLKNYAGNNAQESLTVTTDKGSLKSILGGSVNVVGKSYTAVYDSTDLGRGYKDFEVVGDGTAGKATITIKSTSTSFTKSVTFYASSVATIDKPTLLTTVIATGAGSNNFLVKAYDSEKNQAGSAVTLYAYSSDTGVVSNNGTSCTFVSSVGGHLCSVTGVIAGTATITVRDASTVALSKAASVASDAIRVSTNSAATVKLSFDKASYAPGEKATITVQLLDSAGISVPANTFGNTFATGGISSTLAFGNGSDTLTDVSVATTTDATVSRVTPGKTYTVYMPAAGGTITISATGGTSLPAAGQVKVSATASVTDSGAAALAAVTALATTVASLRTLIVTLTNLVLKIQKKVRA